MNVRTKASTPEIKNYVDSFTLIEKIVLSGLPQWVVMTGQNKNNPLLLFFHGGPGSSMIGAQRKYLSQLEEKYTVVHLDYRGAGKNFRWDIAVQTMTIEQLISDAHELVQELLRRFNQQKILIMGQSFGATVGLRFAKLYPELVYGFVGINQPVHRALEEKLSYKYVLEKDREMCDKK